MTYCACGCGERTSIATYSVARRGWVKGQPKKWIQGHNGRMTIPDKFWAKVERTEGCWLWTGALVYGYGCLRHRSATLIAHRISYELNVGPIPEGLHIDHLCRVRRCVNPAHLEAVTQGENNRRAAVVRWAGKGSAA